MSNLLFKHLKYTHIEKEVGSFIIWEMRKEEKVGEETVKFVMEKLQVIADGLNF